MDAIAPFLGSSVFEPEDVEAMSIALDDVCKTLKINGARAREIIAARIIDLARHGERSPTKLRDCLLDEAGGRASC